MRTFFWTTLFWLAAVAGFLGYLKWFNQDLGHYLTSYIVTQTESPSQACGVPSLPAVPAGSGVVVSGVVAEQPLSLDGKIDEMRAQLKEINEKLDIQNNYTPDAVSISLRTTKKTTIFVWPLDGTGGYKKYVMNPSEDILKDTLNILFDKSAFILKGTQLDNDGNLAITLERNWNIAFGGSAMVAQARAAIEKTALQFSQVKNVNILPEEVLQP